MAVDLDKDPQTDPTYEDTTEKAVVVVSPLNALISDQIELLKSLKSGKKNSVHLSSVLWITITPLLIEARDTIQTILESTSNEKNYYSDIDLKLNDTLKNLMGHWKMTF